MKNWWCHTETFPMGIYWSAFWRPQPKPNQLNNSVTGAVGLNSIVTALNLNTRKRSTDNQCFWLGSPKRTPGKLFAIKTYWVRSTAVDQYHVSNYGLKKFTPDNIQI